MFAVREFGVCEFGIRGSPSVRYNIQVKERAGRIGVGWRVDFFAGRAGGQDLTSFLTGSFAETCQVYISPATALNTSKFFPKLGNHPETDEEAEKRKRYW